MTATVKTDIGSSDSDYVRRERTKVLAHGIKVALVYTEATVDDGDVVVEDISDYGFTTIGGVRGITHTTDNAVLVSEAPTTSVSNGVIRINVGGSTDNKTRTFIMFGRTS